MIKRPSPDTGNSSYGTNFPFFVQQPCIDVLMDDKYSVIKIVLNHTKSLIYLVSQSDNVNFELA